MPKLGPTQMPAETLQSQISKGGETQIYPLSSTEHCGRGLFFIMSKRFQCHLKTVRHKKHINKHSIGVRKYLTRYPQLLAMYFHDYLK